MNASTLPKLYTAGTVPAGYVVAEQEELGWTLVFAVPTALNWQGCIPTPAETLPEHATLLHQRIHPEVIDKMLIWYYKPPDWNHILYDRRLECAWRSLPTILAQWEAKD